ncbi:MAG TPA: hypothetical protein VK646_03495 [Actinomycetota bacterium]|nr:hypothetical protein [Actinomycetota bacterium]
MPGTWGLTKAQARYRPAEKLEVRCDVCAYMFPRMEFGSCKFVRGVIRAAYTCDEFAKRDEDTDKPVGT